MLNINYNISGLRLLFDEDFIVSQDQRENWQMNDELFDDLLYN